MHKEEVEDDDESDGVSDRLAVLSRAVDGGCLVFCLESHPSSP